MMCRYCNKDFCIKKGKRQGVQRYFCKECRKYFQGEYKYKAYNSHINTLLKQLLKEGCGVRSVSRILNISCGTVLSRMLKIAQEVRTPHFSKMGRSFEVDELWSFVGTKANAVWITYALERITGKVVDFMVGRKTSANIRPLIHKLLLLYPKRIFTDRLNIYPALIPKSIHKVFKYCTNKIERKNLTLRTHIKRLSRRTICFSKKQNTFGSPFKDLFLGIGFSFLPIRR